MPLRSASMLAVATLECLGRHGTGGHGGCSIWSMAWNQHTHTCTQTSELMRSRLLLLAGQPAIEQCMARVWVTEQKNLPHTRHRHTCASYSCIWWAWSLEALASYESAALARLIIIAWSCWAAWLEKDVASSICMYIYIYWKWDAHDMTKKCTYKMGEEWA